MAGNEGIFLINHQRIKVMEGVEDEKHIKAHTHTEGVN
jgi:hypothetical protein